MSYPANLEHELITKPMATRLDYCRCTDKEYDSSYRSFGLQLCVPRLRGHSSRSLPLIAELQVTK